MVLKIYSIKGGEIPEIKIINYLMAKDKTTSVGENLGGLTHAWNFPGKYALGFEGVQPRNRNRFRVNYITVSSKNEEIATEVKENLEKLCKQDGLKLK